MTLPPLSGLYLVTTATVNRTNEEIVKAAIDGGVKTIQLREKSWPKEKYKKEAQKISKFCKEKSVLFFVNTFAEIAKEVDAAGVHLPESFSVKDARKIVGKKIIGKSVHSIDSALSAEKEGADYLILGPVFSTAGKPKGIGLEPLKEAVRSIRIPVFAIGGINHRNIREVMQMGVSGAAVISAIGNADNICKATQKLVSLVGPTKNIK